MPSALGPPTAAPPPRTLPATARAAARAHFAPYAAPHLSLTVEVEVGAHWDAARRRGFTPFLATLWSVAHAANAVPALRQRLRPGSPDDPGGLALVEHPLIHPAVAVPGPEDTFAHCRLTFDPDPARFCADAAPALAAARAEGGLGPPPPDDARLFCTCVPWLRFTQVTHPWPGDPLDAVPRLAWGRADPTPDGGRRMPLSIQAHHAVVDGLHAARFFAAFEEAAAALG